MGNHVFIGTELVFFLYSVPTMSLHALLRIVRGCEHQKQRQDVNGI